LHAAEYPTYPAGIKVAVAGDAGVGKSSLINSLLGEKSIADMGDDGKSVTYVVQEFGPPLPTQKTPFAAEVHFFDQTACKENLKDYFRSYFRMAEHDVGQAEDDPTAETMEDLDEGAETVAQSQEPVEDSGITETALEIFTALFANKEEFADEDAAKTFLATAKSDDDPEVVEQFELWVDELMDQLQLQDSRKFIEGADVEELTENIAPYTKTIADDGPVESRSPSLWPLVRLIKIGLHSKLLASGIVLVDLPGISDINQLRAKATELYLRKCDYTVVVGEIKRILTDPSVHKNLTDAARRRRNKFKAVFLAVTGADNITIQHNKTTSFNPVQLENFEQYKSDLKKLQAEAIQCSNDVKAAKGQLERVTALERTRNLLKYRSIPQTKQKMDAIFIEARNNAIMAGMGKKWANLTGDKNASLPVFCVFNKIYSTHVDGYEAASPPLMTVEGTQIPSLR